MTKPYVLTIADSAAGQEFRKEVSIAYFATEIKTNLDKTMFQEASATAGELKAAVPGARYILLCEWLDMAPIDSRLTSIDEVIVLRKQRRVGAGLREKFSTVKGRAGASVNYRKFLTDNPIHKESLERFLFHLNETFPDDAGSSLNDVLERGYF